MRSTLVVTALILLCAATGFAQEYKADLFGGYSYLRSDPGFSLPAGNASGWEGAFTYNWNNWLALKADVSGHYCCDQTMHNFLFGPQINLGHGKLKPYLHGLVGVSHGTSTGGFSDTVLGFALGGGIDVKWTERLSVRIVQADYLGTRYADATQNNFRLSAGLVYRFGKK
ncbi:MAG: porin family protein [Acidobacteriia bacterium]|nr:porin family protein [Terriglobia bacterium]